MRSGNIFLMVLAMLFFTGVYAQQPGKETISGIITNTNASPVKGATVQLKGGTFSAVAADNGTFYIHRIAPGTYILLVTAVGYEAQEKSVTVQPGHISQVSVQLQPAVSQINAVEVREQSATAALPNKAFTATVVDVKKIRDRDVDMNRLLDAVSGVRVRETGGLGSEFNYSINGLSGKAVKFFIDGIPMDNFGTAFSINNLPVNMVDRVEVYKGVTPIELGGDALGGAVNIITRKDKRSYLDASYTMGSFQTHKLAVSGKWQQPKGFVISTQAFYNYSKNNYQVWGRTIELVDEYSRPLPGEPRLRRFNDDYTALNITTEAGVTNKRWADQLLLGITLADLRKGIQTGRTMAFVYGDVRYNEKLWMPHLKFSKKDLFTKGLQADIFASYSQLEGTTVDTGTRKYNWAGAVISDKVKGELGGIKARQSIYTFNDHNLLARGNMTYRLSEQHIFRFNYVLNHLRRTGTDKIGVAAWTIPFREPQQLQKQVAGLSYEILCFDQRWSNTFFAKHFSYQAGANTYGYNDHNEQVVTHLQMNDQAWGGGYASRLQLKRNLLLKLSMEYATRLPEAVELLGDGNTILNAPTLKPERSMNINAGVQQQWEGKKYRIGVNTGVFYRNTNNLIWLGEGDHFGTARYENISKIASRGVEAEFSYSNKKWLEATANVTWQDIRNKEAFTNTGAPNIVYNDRLRNMPWLMANGEVRFNKEKLFGLPHHLSCYVSTHYVQEYFLGWPSMGERPGKKIIPGQFVQDAGVTLRLKDNRYSISLECRNIFDQQVYDNYLLQKPGRYNSIKLRYFLSNSSH
ncbi:TonB-dependent receptor [Chitinophaga nivalis]|uniref:TonB-dependent receptor n=1 Tax=Chitinophaga nivalis TaxID=2991709 RepID=A0ABT3IH26_9BACT|nr:TonB-dependent receptor [Chitinophaga nivalis]MCW3467058.1 TonB-dependent receptor [Chitinophaga nivalis]MCW3483251.1 TonB-dependent receptor [Chitinophaga nivalis]